MLSVCVKDVYVKETQPMYVFVYEKKVQCRNNRCFQVEKIKCVKRVTLEMREREQRMVEVEGTQTRLRCTLQWSLMEVRQEQQRCVQLSGQVMEGHQGPAQQLAMAPGYQLCPLDDTHETTKCKKEFSNT